MRDFMSNIIFTANARLKVDNRIRIAWAYLNRFKWDFFLSSSAHAGMAGRRAHAHVPYGMGFKPLG